MTMNARLRSGSQSVASNDDIKTLLMQMEDRLSAKLDGVIARIETIEKSIHLIKDHQVQLESEIKSVKKVIINQQHQIERMEVEKRKCNVVLTGVSENDVFFGHDVLESDLNKVITLAKIATADELNAGDFISCSRIGKAKDGAPRPILVQTGSPEASNMFFSHQKRLRTSISCSDSFGNVYVNRDSSFLARKEEKRLRDHRRELSGLNPNAKVYLKSNKLYLNDVVVDQFDLSKQLF